MANIWHPIKGVHIRDLGEKRFLLQFYHVMDLDRVLKGSSWTFNNHLLVLHKLQWGEDPLKIPLFMVPFWVQMHDVPIGFFSENLAVQLGNFIGEFIEYDGLNLEKENRNYMRLRVKIDGENLMSDRALIDMEHDLGDDVLIGEEGKKGNRGEIEGVIVLGNENSLTGRNRRVLEVNNFVLAAAKRQTYRTQ
ncbi:hypothetical protein Golob_007675 [Gossypium lobatum]|uniref:DUF4283 domain-containing protein n=1 Tax=Gossypium lobatum TaxID=34289 RepID=A0A7J8MD44_9ROSI|nr:hypothetical protein [Gossypium lobatum]